MPTYAVEFDLPSAAELALVAQIRKNSSAEIGKLKDTREDVCGDLRIVRFLRAKKQDVKVATEAFKEFLRWRVTEHAPGGTPEEWSQEIVGRTPEDFENWRRRRHNPYDPCNFFVGDNADGMMLLAFAWGYVDPLKWAESRHKDWTMEHDFKVGVQCFEWVMWELTRRTQERQKMCYVLRLVDLAGWGGGGRQTLLDTQVGGDKRWFNVMGSRMNQNYCDHNAAYVVINVPTFATFLWKFAKLFLSKRQQAKAVVVGDMKNKAKQTEVLQYVPPEFLPAAYGGTLTTLKFVWPPPDQAEADLFMQQRHLVKPEFADTRVEGAAPSHNFKEEAAADQAAVASPDPSSAEKKDPASVADESAQQGLVLENLAAKPPVPETLIENSAQAGPRGWFCC